jgi:serine/threonine protein kinase
MEATVESLCTALVRSRLLTPDAVRGLYQRWLREAKEGAPDVKRFSHWLVDNQVVSEYQLGVLSRGRGDQLFLNQYKLIDRVGRGRMAGVYKAVHNLGQAVAIKVLPPSKARDPAIFARFQREARLALRLNHPNVVRTFQTDEADGLHYLVMEYLEGETLAEVLARRKALTPPEAVRVVYQALLGLQHLHEQGLVHRDLTPANLMLVGGEPDDVVKATVKILDIGTGRELFDEESRGENEFALTNEGDVLGTPLYMAPEQAGDPHGADIRADLYSLGCVLYHGLAGRPPFEDKSSVRLLVRHATETPRPVADLCRDAPAGLQRVLDRLLAKDRTKRFAVPDEARMALLPFLNEAVSNEFGPARPEFRAYLQWLDAQGGPSESEPPPRAPAAPVPGLVPQDLLSDLAKSAAGMQAPASLREAVEARKRAKKAPKAAARSQPARPPAKPPEKAKEPPRQPGPPQESQDVELLAAEEPQPAETMAEALPVEPLTVISDARPSGLSGRDLLMVGIGVGVVCMLLLAVVIVLLLIR